MLYLNLLQLRPPIKTNLNQKLYPFLNLYPIQSSELAYQRQLNEKQEVSYLLFFISQVVVGRQLLVFRRTRIRGSKSTSSNARQICDRALVPQQIIFTVPTPTATSLSPGLLLHTVH
jgi:hypothetical protein